MTRIKTIGFSLKALPSKLKGLLFSYRIAGSGFLLAILLWLLTAGCDPPFFDSLGPPPTVVNGFALKEHEMENVRYEPQGLSGPIPTIQTARAYWLKRGEMIAPKWDTFEWHWEHQDAMMMCDFRSNTSVGNCQVCDFCNPPSSTNGPPCMGFFPAISQGILQVVADPGFIRTDNPQTILDYRINRDSLLQTCANSTQNPLVFEPAMSGLYRFLALDFKYNIVGGSDGEVKIHVVEKGEGLAQSTAYQLMPQTVDGANYWIWTDVGNPLWLENFSPNLSVTYVRIFRGRCGDGSAQGKQCIPGESVLVRPSRILFLPDFQGTVSGHPGESSHRCYSNPNASDGNFIKLDICRERHDYPLSQINPKLTTPTYEPAPAGPLQKLTWLVEFNTLEGADADLRTPNPDPMPADAELIIEFTIQANN